MSTCRLPLVGLLAVLVALCGAQMLEKRVYSPIKEDLPYIACESCHKAVKSVHRKINELRKESKAKLSEDSILEIVEKVCNPLLEHGDWIRRLDVSLSKGKVKLVDMGAQSKCRRECRTIARACDDVVADADTDLAEMLYRDKMSLAQMTNRVCLEPCKRKLGQVDRRDVDEYFEEMDEKEAERERLMEKMAAGMPGLPEMYGPDDLAGFKDAKETKTKTKRRKALTWWQWLEDGFNDATSWVISLFYTSSDSNDEL